MSHLHATGAARLWRALFALGVAALVVPEGARAQGGTWAITNARIVTVTRGVIPRGTLVISEGLITAVGADVTPPPEARVLDVAGRTVSPGLIDLTSSLGLPAAPAPGPGGPGAAAAGAPAGGGGPADVGLEPDRVVADELKPAPADIKAARDAGLTTVLSAPSRGAFRGLSALVPLRDSAGTRDVLKSPVALHMGFQGVGGGGFGGGFARRYPATLLGVIAYERQRFYDAQRQALLLERYRANPRGMARPANDNALAALIPVVRGDLPVFFAANNENEILRAIRIAREFNLKLTVVGATEGFRVADALAGLHRPVVVSVDFPRPTEVTGWSYRAAERLPPDDSAAADTAARRVLEGNAAQLMRAGVPFALASGGTRGSDFIANVRKAVAAGLPRDTALAALTIRPAEIAGVAEQVGSVEPGKIANLVVSDGDLLGDSGRVRMVFVDGVRYTVDAPAPGAGAGGGGRGRGRFGGPGGGGAGPAASGAAELAQVAGTWDITINSPQGSQSSVLTLAQNGASLTGTMANQMGNLDIGDGQVEGRRVTWTVTFEGGGRSMTVRFQGEVDGNRMTGSAALGDFGTASFTGEKRP